LITGAGGSIGSELCRQVHRFGPSQLIMLDRDESALHAVELSIHGRALMESPDLVLCDIREASVVQAHFERLKPEVVFHAAALKHLPMLEQYPEEGWKTNVLGTANVLAASAAVGVKTFVNISTDKAANPSSVLGVSKRIAEGVTAGYAETALGDYVSVRFGNVLGSRGSVLESFAHQIGAGGPVTVTDPEITRYFMTIPEASQLVIQAAALGYNCDALVLDMGEPVRIMDVAQQMIAMSGRTGIEIKITGLRSAEKLHEDLVDSSEEQEPTTHPLISRVKVGSIHLGPGDLVPDQIVARWMSGEYRTNAQGANSPQF
jgi:FlaA1/EpsC-like NDP-sugar epimerase